ncbi:hypothetical protein AB0O34_34750 [Sphaerisporangium sp. NPDC088356]|uniref:TRADD-N-associated membrane domain-containing protein n=1 Tax=Sphaerisporangium sp. NPDC088356 TaxID=3154871 RepID=UPI00341EDB0E
MSGIEPFLLPILMGVGGALISEFSTLLSRRLDRQASKESQRLRRMVGLEVDLSHESPTEKAIVNFLREAEENPNLEDLRTEISEIRDQLAKVQQSPTENDHRLSLLIEIYSQALAQMKISFRLSLAFASLGAMILLAGVTLAIFRASTDGDQVAAILTSVAGVVINITSGLFFVQSARALKHLERQADHLREDVRLDEIVKGSEDVISRVEDSGRRDDLRSHIVFRLLGSSDKLAPPAAIP